MIFLNIIRLLGYVLFDSFTRATGIRRAWLKSRSCERLLHLIAARRRVVERRAAKGRTDYHEDIEVATAILANRGLSSTDINSRVSAIWQAQRTTRKAKRRRPTS